MNAKNQEVILRYIGIKRGGGTMHEQRGINGYDLVQMIYHVKCGKASGKDRIKA